MYGFKKHTKGKYAGAFRHPTFHRDDGSITTLVSIKRRPPPRKPKGLDYFREKYNTASENLIVPGGSKRLANNEHSSFSSKGKGHTHDDNKQKKPRCDRNDSNDTIQNNSMNRSLSPFHSHETTTKRRSYSVVTPPLIHKKDDNTNDQDHVPEAKKSSPSPFHPKTPERSSPSPYLFRDIRIKDEDDNDDCGGNTTLPKNIKSLNRIMIGPNIGQPSMTTPRPAASTFNIPFSPLTRSNKNRKLNVTTPSKPSKKASNLTPPRNPFGASHIGKTLAAMHPTLNGPEIASSSSNLSITEKVTTLKCEEQIDADSLSPLPFKSDTQSSHYSIPSFGKNLRMAFDEISDDDEDVTYARGNDNDEGSNGDDDDRKWHYPNSSGVKSSRREENARFVTPAGYDGGNNEFFLDHFSSSCYDALETEKRNYVKDEMPRAIVPESCYLPNPPSSFDYYKDLKREFYESNNEDRNVYTMEWTVDVDDIDKLSGCHFFDPK